MCDHDGCKTPHPPAEFLYSYQKWRWLRVHERLVHSGAKQAARLEGKIIEGSTSKAKR